MSASNAIDEIRIALGGNKLKIVVVDEVSMLSTQFLILLDSRLRAIYKPDVPFGGISILLIGDFVQLPVTSGRDLWSVMYGNVTGNDATARNLFQMFRIHELTANMRAADCMMHTRHVAAFRKLPLRYPLGQKWTADDNKRYQPITADVLKAITQQLTPNDIEQDLNWITQSTCIVTSNVDRAIINAQAAIIFAQHNNVPVLRWKHQLRQELTLCVQAILYDEEARPELFAYFVQGGPGQVLDNSHGNVFLGVANGSACTMHSLAWDNPEDEKEACKAIAKGEPGQVIDLPTPPDHIIVDIKPKQNIQWPQHLNLSPDSDVIRIPIGLTTRCDRKAKVGLDQSVSYYAHAVDLAFAITVWKCQGGTFKYIIALLEHSPGSPALSFENLYVMFTRVKKATNFRCLPLSSAFNKQKLLHLRPKILATKWRMDIE